MYSKIDPRKPAKFTGEMYGTKVTVELDHSDIGMDEMFEAFKTIAAGLGWSEESWKHGIKDLADQYNEQDDWDNTLNDGLDESDYPDTDGATKFVKELTDEEKKSFRKIINDLTGGN